ncbi:MAG: hypothetical protein JW959_01050 [Pirellulales bacterium]|nr:hypothetical protein [Pirellulales bacterium]
MPLLPKLLSFILVVACIITSQYAGAAEGARLATFRCDITPPKGQPLAGNDLLQTVEQPLLAKGVVLDANGRRYVICALDWCVVCNDSYHKLRGAIAEAAGVSFSRVAVQTVHQHTAPAIDIDPAPKPAGKNDDKSPPDFDAKVYDALVGRIAAAVRESLDRFQPFDRVGAGQAKVDRVASCRRMKDAEGKIRTRWSYVADLSVRNLPEGKIDPYLKTVTFARGEKPLVRMHYYATHPQTKYRDGRASSDIPGDAREELERKEGVFQVYFTGCAGDVTLGKYNEQTKENRAALAGRLLAGMEAASANTKFAPLGVLRWRTHLFSPLWKKDADADGKQIEHRPIELTSLQIGDIYMLHLPGEPLVDFQLYARRLRPDSFVAVAGYGDDGTGYICPKEAFSEGGYEPSASLLEPESEELLKKAVAELLGVE